MRIDLIEARLNRLELLLAALEQDGRTVLVSQLPDDWQPRTEDIDWAKEEYPNVNEARERNRFRDYWIGTGKPRTNWDATYRNWIRRAAEFSPAKSLPMPRRSTTRGAAIGEANRERGARALDKLASFRDGTAG